MQTSYSASMATGKAGMVADNGPKDVLSRSNPNVAIPFGRVVVRGTDKDNNVKLPTVTGDIAKAVGVSLRDLGTESQTDSADANYPVESQVACVRKGRVFVEVEEAVTPDDSVFIRHGGKKQVQTIVLDADLVASNVLAGTLGETEISVTFDTDHATTMAALETAVEAVPGILSATVGGASNRTLTILTEQDGDDVDLGGDFAVTLGASQAGVTEAESQAAVNTSERGLFRTDADNDEDAAATATVSTAFKFMSSASAGELAVVEVNL